MSSKTPLAILALAVGSACGGAFTTDEGQHAVPDGATAGSDATGAPTNGDDASRAPADAAMVGDDVTIGTPPGDAATDADAGKGTPDAHVAHDAGDAATGCGNCNQGKVCAYLIADGCSAVGMCVAKPAPSPCTAIVLETACGCDGTTVHWTGGCQPSLPSGYAPAPVTHTGACP